MANRAAPPRHEREQFWRDLIAQQRRSDQPIAAFCRDHGVSQPSFFSWRKRLRLHSGQPASPFVPVELSSPLAQSAPIEIVLSCGTCVRIRPGCDRQMLETVLAVLEPPPC